MDLGALILALVVLGPPHPADAQSARKAPTIGYVGLPTCVLNLKTARAIGVTIPPSLVLRADRVIE